MNPNRKQKKEPKRSKDKDKKKKTKDKEKSTAKKNTPSHSYLTRQQSRRAENRNWLTALQREQLIPRVVITMEDQQACIPYSNSRPSTSVVSTQPCSSLSASNPQPSTSRVTDPPPSTSSVLNPQLSTSRSPNQLPSTSAGELNPLVFISRQDQEICTPYLNSLPSTSGASTRRPSHFSGSTAQPSNSGLLTPRLSNLSLETPPPSINRSPAPQRPISGNSASRKSDLRPSNPGPSTSRKSDSQPSTPLPSTSGTSTSIITTPVTTTPPLASRQPTAPRKSARRKSVSQVSNLQPRTLWPSPPGLSPSSTPTSSSDESSSSSSSSSDSDSSASSSSSDSGSPSASSTPLPTDDTTSFVTERELDDPLAYPNDLILDRTEGPQGDGEAAQTSIANVRTNNTAASTTEVESVDLSTSTDFAMNTPAGALGGEDAAQTMASAAQKSAPPKRNLEKIEDNKDEFNLPSHERSSRPEDDDIEVLTQTTAANTTNLDTDGPSSTPDDLVLYIDERPPGDGEAAQTSIANVRTNSTAASTTEAESVDPSTSTDFAMDTPAGASGGEDAAQTMASAAQKSAPPKRDLEKIEDNKGEFNLPSHERSSRPEDDDIEVLTQTIAANTTNQDTDGPSSSPDDLVLYIDERPPGDGEAAELTSADVLTQSNAANTTDPESVDMFASPKDVSMDTNEYSPSAGETEQTLASAAQNSNEPKGYFKTVNDDNDECVSPAQVHTSSPEDNGIEVLTQTIAAYTTNSDTDEPNSWNDLALQIDEGPLGVREAAELTFAEGFTQISAANTSVDMFASLNDVSMDTNEYSQSVGETAQTPALAAQNSTEPKCHFKKVNNVNDECVSPAQDHTSSPEDDGIHVDTQTKATHTTKQDSDDLLASSNDLTVDVDEGPSFFGKAAETTFADFDLPMSTATNTSDPESIELFSSPNDFSIDSIEYAPTVGEAAQMLDSASQTSAEPKGQSQKLKYEHAGCISPAHDRSSSPENDSIDVLMETTSAQTTKPDSDDIRASSDDLSMDINEGASCVGDGAQTPLADLQIISPEDDDINVITQTISTDTTSPDSDEPLATSDDLSVIYPNESASGVIEVAQTPPVDLLALDITNDTTQPDSDDLRVSYDDIPMDTSEG